MKGLAAITILLIGIAIAVSLSITVLASNPDQTTTTVSVTNAPPWIEAKWELPDDNTAVPGTQVLPVQNGVKIVRKCVAVCDNNGAVDIISVIGRTYYPDTTLKELETLHIATTAEFTECQVEIYDPEFINKPGVCELYVGNINMQYYDPAGNYTVEVIAGDSGGLQNPPDPPAKNQFEYLELVALELDTTLVDFGSIAPGTTSQVLGDADMITASAPTIKNAGNVPIDLDPIIATDLTTAVGASIANDNLATGFQTSFFDVFLGADASPFAKYDLNLTLTGLNLENFQLAVPLATAPGAYTGSVTLTAVKSV
ncbi:MAG: hypothetical protein HZB67_01535 [Candidatus Aenigmarchaeota archaeon]|nr:hypothetical protein [Candidatus Aenigmarchaeota archaeon]